MRISGLRVPFLVAALAVFSLSPANAALLIQIDKSAQRMSVTRDGAEIYSWPVSTGRSGYDTPAGEFKPFRMEADHFSKEWDDAPMPHSIFFTKVGHAIHGSYETKRLGSAASHGCVRLSPANANTLFALVKSEGLPNVKVEIKGDIALAKRNPGVDDNAREPRIPQQREAAREQTPQYPDAGTQGYQQQRSDDRYPQFPRYQRPSYGQPYGTQPNYAQQDYGQPQYAQPYQSAPRYLQPQYAPRPYYGQPRYQDDYDAPPVYRRPRGYYNNGPFFDQD